MTDASPIRLFTKMSVIAFGAALAIFAALYFTAQPTVAEQVETARTVLERARAERQIASIASISAAALHETDQAQERKSLFVAMMLPLIALENERVRAQRAAVERAASSAQLSALARAYGLSPENVDPKALLKRIDVLPESLVLAQAAIESAWGASRFAREGNAFFGERTYDPTVPGITPQQATGFKVKSFAAPVYSVRSYMRTLNSHAAYRTLRERRATLRAQGRRASGADLAGHLGRYSEIGQEYVTRILTTIAANRWEMFDGIALAKN